MRNYQEHHQLICLLGEMTELLEARSRMLAELAAGQGITFPHSAVDQSASCLQAAFAMLSRHAITLEGELNRLTNHFNNCHSSPNCASKSV